MIDWIRAENAGKLRICLKDGSSFIASGNGLEIGVDIGEDEDMFFIRYQGKPMMLPLSSIEGIDILDEGT